MFCKLCRQDRHISLFQKDSAKKSGVRMPCRNCRGKVVQPRATVSRPEPPQSHIIESLLKQSGGSVTFHRHLKRFSFMSHSPFLHLEDADFDGLLESAGKKIAETQAELIEVS